MRKKLLCKDTKEYWANAVSRFVRQDNYLLIGYIPTCFGYVAVSIFTGINVGKKKNQYTCLRFCWNGENHQRMYERAYGKPYAVRIAREFATDIVRKYPK